ncbi:MurJ-like flippase [Thalassoglobus neptunius]|uniref:MurJ-like flippase n=1 Tax=Thalassoglobus neptunius TaxID=1938619 RepID=A0A5C5X556_9PLAN|nr:lipid II flippase MurJ [Thalassoglobus neptunius]TWT57739.1 MurJ-like flippase [Thalassoglobus neptunius]
MSDPNQNSIEPVEDSGLETRSLPRFSSTFLVVFLGTVVQILLQFLLQILLAKLFGTRIEFEAYTVALTIPIAVSAVIAGTISAPLVTFMNRIGDLKDRREFAGTVLVVIGMVCLGIAAVGMVVRTPLMHWYLQGDQSELEQLSAKLFAILVWLIPANAAIGLFQAVLQQSLEFRIPAIAGGLGPLVTVLTVAVFARDSGIEVVAWGTIAGAVCNLMIQLRSLSTRVQWTISRNQLAAFASLILAGVPILIGTLVLKADSVVDPSLASAMSPGSIGHLRYATQLMTIFVVLGSGTLSTLVFPKLAISAASDRGLFLRDASMALRTLIQLLVPSLVVIFLFGPSLVADLYQRGEFQPSDTLEVTSLMKVLSGFFIGAGLCEIAGKIFVSDHDTWTPNVVGSIGVGLGITAKLTTGLVQDVTSLATITSIVFLSCGLILWAILAFRYGTEILSGAMSGAAVSGISAIAAGVIGGAINMMNFPFSSVVGLFAGAATYFAVLLSIDPHLRQLVMEPRHSSEQIETTDHHE